EEDENLEALFDRFILRFEVKRIEEEANFISMMKATEKNELMPSMTMEELLQLQKLAEQVEIPDVVYEALIKIRHGLKDEGIRPSDRRFKQSLSLLQAKALVNQRQIVV
ncbi:hypothetical protein J4G37_57370, partial [Microvirga sp. 3-52]|nr:hypothetical protein [Microvirga sp. 3-52]